MKLFEVFPKRFFNLLAGKNKHIYAEAILLVYEQSQQERFGIRYDHMRDILQELIEAHESLGFVYEEEENPSMSNGENQLSIEELSRIKANQLLRKLDQLKWVNVEHRDNFQQYIVLPHYTSKLAALFQELCEGRAVEYQRFAFITYQLLTGSEAKQRPSFAVLEAEKLTNQFQQELITMYNNMKHHMEQVVMKTKVRDVLDHHFDEYKIKILDGSYHRLKTSDHVAKYRFLILDTVQKWLLDKDWLSETTEDGLRNQFFTCSEEAEQSLRAALQKIEEIYYGLDEIFYQIDVRHNQYLRASYDRARYLSQHNQGIDQRLAQILEWLADNIGQSKSVEDKLLTSFPLQQLNQLDNGSFFTPRKRRQLHESEVHVVVPISKELKEDLRKQNLDRLRRAVTREKVAGFVLNKLGERAEMSMEEMAPINLEEFLLLSYVYLYGYDGKSGYTIIRCPKHKVLLVGKYRFSVHRICRTEAN